MLLRGDRPDLDGSAHASCGDGGRDLDDGVMVVAVEQVDGAEQLPRVGDRAVDLDRSAVSDTHGGRLLRRRQSVVADHSRNVRDSVYSRCRSRFRSVDTSY
jgi:hypothetical protein